MRFVAERTALLVAVQAAVKLAATKYCVGPNFGRVLMSASNGMLRVSATDATTHLEAYLPANMLDVADPISTKSKEFAYLLKKQATTPLIEVVGSRALDTAVVYNQDGTDASFPNDHELDWEEHDSAPAVLYATLRLDTLARALFLADDFMSSKPDSRCYGLHIEPNLRGDRPALCFSATNGHILTVAELQTGVYATAASEQSLFIEYPAVQALLCCLRLWEDLPVDQVDCEIRLVKRQRTNEDGEVWDLDPAIFFDLSGGGYRVVVSTMQRGQYVDYHEIVPEPARPGVVLCAQAGDLNQLAQLAIRASGKQKAKIGFRFFYDSPADGCMVRIGYAVAKPPPPEGANKQVGPDGKIVDAPDYDVQQHNLPGGYYGALVGDGMAAPEPDEDIESSRIVAMDARYLSAMCKHQHGKMLLKFHGSRDLIEAMEAADTPVDGIYAVGMPIDNGFTKEEL